MQKVDISIILPCYNEGPTFEKSISKIVSILKKTRKKWEIIFVEDKSTDKTRTTVEKLALQIKNAKAIFHQRNHGRGQSVSDGIIAAAGDICGYLDVDLEVSANYIPIFIDEIEKGADMAIGKRFYEGNLKSSIRFVTSKIYATTVKLLLNIPIEDTEAGYKFFRRSQILPILAKVRDKKWFWDTEICTLCYLDGFKIVEVPILFIRRGDKKSTVKLIGDSWAYISQIIKFKSRIAKTKPVKI